MERELQNRLVTLLLQLPGIEEFATRSTLLLGIVNRSSLSRSHTNARADISGIVNQLAQVRLQDGQRAILFVIDNAIPYVDGFMVGEQLKELRLQIADPC